MKFRLLTLLTLVSALAFVVCSCRKKSAPTEAPDNRLVILHTNDTHSAIDPDRHDLGGIARRKVVIDSVRDANKNVLLIDAGDAVQGSLYYTLFSGEVERKLMNLLGYDIRILGNHEFDKGPDILAKEWKEITATRLSTNYDFDGTPLEGLFVPTVMKEYGDKKVGFIGINLNPDGIIADPNYEGIEYTDALQAANEAAARLKKEGASMVIAVTHIGYKDMAGHSDIDLARATKNIDVIIGGHSHTTIDPNDTREGVPAWQVTNAEGKQVAVFQTGSSGVNIGEIDIDLNTGKVKGRLIPIDNRLDDRLDPQVEEMIAPYRTQVEAMRSEVIGHTPYEYGRKSTEMLNLLSDFVKQRGEELCGKPVDLAIMNKGGIRNSLAAGDITQGEIIDIAPFDNSIVVMEIKGKDLLENFRIMASQEGQGVSLGTNAVYDPATLQLSSVTINGKKIDPEATYRVATIDYLAAGNDYMEPLAEGTIIAESREILYKILIEYIKAGKLDRLLANPDKKARMTTI